MASTPEPQSPASGAPSVQRTPSKHSIIAGNSGRTERVDSYGKKIEKGKKHHRCSFVDERDPSKPIEDKVEVTAYKGQQNYDNYDSQPGCSCNVM
mmetsp:Transcript_31892/g.64483  ORF Transcript_31892/g.64483 Transcript_31892/m.64483 type:complete len:95 (-) Transcript_31892:134-418(-)